MIDMFKDAPMNISVIDVIGKIGNGVGLLLSLLVENTTYEIGYWFNKEGLISIVPEKRLIEKLNIDDIYEYKYINEFVYFIHNSLPDTDMILNEFLN